jgi:hypothetical protein
MKKVIAILVVVVIALVGLSSYNSNPVKKEKTGDDTLIASVVTNTKGIPLTNTTPTKRPD